MTWSAYIDGSSLGNPGEAGYGVILQDDKGNVVKSVGQYIGKATNNVAEYQALISCLELAVHFGVRSLTVYSDSELLVKQIKGIYRVRQDHLRILHSKTLDVLKRTPIKFDIQHISRDINKGADQLARRAVRVRSKIDE